ncbi:MAG: hypothetical protein IH623_04775 [Verrucomicrobia bacterium]|nr:hypothetical protein [Verrucomicrobiota bacterium]
MDAGQLQPSCKAAAVFRQRGYWASKSTRQETSRDRYTGQNVAREITDLEIALREMGFRPGYWETIREKVTRGRADAHALHLYRAALERTLRAKCKQLCGSLTR